MSLTIKSNIFEVPKARRIMAHKDFYFKFRQFLYRYRIAFSILVILVYSTLLILSFIPGFASNWFVRIERFCWGILLLIIINTPPERDVARAPSEVNFKKAYLADIIQHFHDIGFKTARESNGTIILKRGKGLFKREKVVITAYEDYYNARGQEQAISTIESYTLQFRKA